MTGTSKYGIIDARGILFEKSDKGLKEYYYRDLYKHAQYGDRTGNFIIDIHETEPDGRTDFWSYGQKAVPLNEGWKCVGKVSPREFWGNIQVLDYIGEEFLRYKINDDRDIDDLYNDLVTMHHFNRVVTNKKPEYKGNKVIIDDNGYFINSYQVIKGLPAIPEPFRPLVQVGKFYTFEWCRNIEYYTLGNWRVLPPLGIIPTKYKQKVRYYIDVMVQNLQGVEL